MSFQTCMTFILLWKYDFSLYPSDFHCMRNEMKQNETKWKNKKHISRDISKYFILGNKNKTKKRGGGVQNKGKQHNNNEKNISRDISKYFILRSKKKIIIQVWKNMSMSKWWQFFLFLEGVGVKYPFKHCWANAIRCQRSSAILSLALFPI